MKSIHDVLDELRDASFDERHKGDLFEALTKKFLEIDPFYGSYFDKVWLYGDWATETKISKQDTGIDLVARIAETGEIAAIQCKFYAEGAYLDKKEIDSFFTASGKEPFRERYIFSTTDNWSKNASDAVEGQQIPTTIIRVQDLDESGIDWSGFSLENVSNIGLLKKKTPFPHQLEAIEAAKAHFASADRGKMIMACGTGKTFTSLQIVQEMTPKGGTVLFLVPSLALLSQTLKEWKRESSVDFRAYAVCSDTKLSKQASTEDTRVADLAYPSTTNVEKLASHFHKGTEAELTVIFSTYQSIEVVAAAQKKGLPEFDLIICDEAHRTTGVTLAGEDESNFVRVHDKDFIKGSKRLYMTATPRIYAEASKAKAEEASAVLASMDNEEQFGQEFHRLNFGNAVSRGLLSDYKVLVLTVSETQVSKSLQKILTDGDELKLQDAIKIVGCYNGLRKRSTNPDDFLVDKTPMRTAVAFSRSIKDSKRIADLFGTVTKALNDEAKEKDGLIAEADHVDGTFNVMARNERLDWLKDTKTENTVRVLSNARCLSEGVDVPALDAVLFLNPRDSQVDVVQSVGRVMRKAEGKQYGYVILPIAVPAGKSAEEALADNKNYKVVWQVLQALRAHDERFDALVNKIDLTGDTGGVIEIIDASPGSGEGDWEGDSKPKDNGQMPLFEFDFTDWKDAILAKIVHKVGERTYWENWAKDVAEIAKNHISRISHIVSQPDSHSAVEFSHFIQGLHDNINPAITQSDAIEMLAQHLITKPVFDALFEGFEFTEKNPVSLAMQRMIIALEDSAINKEDETLDDFYQSVRLRVSGITDAAAKQRIIKDLYERFFKLAFSESAERLGIVYTPNEIVDFVNASADFALKKHFGKSLSSNNVHILDPFTGTGTFLVRLMQSGLISRDDIVRKYRAEMHANELVLLAYYVGAINIEQTFHAITNSPYESFQGIVLTDTFQMSESDDKDELPGFEVFVENNERVIAQKSQKVQVILGNPPYSGGQSSANDNNANLKYPTLDARISETYAARSVAQNKNKLYDSYYRALRWASDRIKDDGIVAFVTNNGFVDSNTASGVRLALADEFTSIYVLNLRGNSLSAGESAKREGGNVFDIRVGVAITILVKDGKGSHRGEINYFETPDFQKKQEKLDFLTTTGHIGNITWGSIKPNDNGDWINQRSVDFEEFVSLGSKDKVRRDEVRIFANYSRGLESGRDAWVYNFSADSLAQNVARIAENYNAEVERSLSDKPSLDSVSSWVDPDPRKVSWSRSLRNSLLKGKKASVDLGRIRPAVYRAFTKQNLYFDDLLNHERSQMPKFFPDNGERNFGFYITGLGALKDFSVLMIDEIPDVNLWGSEGGQFFPRYSFDSQDAQESLLFSSSGAQDNITSDAIRLFSRKLGHEFTSDELFFYTYGILNSREYQTSFQSDLKRVMPRIPILKNWKEFYELGFALSKLHLGYESVEKYALTLIGQAPSGGKFEKLKFARNEKEIDKSTILIAGSFGVSGIPEEAFDFKLGSKSVIELLMDRYQLKVEKDSGIVNDPNEKFDAEDMADLISRMVTVCVETEKLRNSVPKFQPVVED